MSAHEEQRPSDAAEPDATDASPADSAHDDDDDTPIKIPGFFRRNMWWLLGVLALSLAGPSISHMLRSYRAVVLRVDAKRDKMYIMWQKRPPHWVDAAKAQPGDIVIKQTGHWDPVVVKPTEDDQPLEELYRRYVRTYTGVISKIIPPRTPTAPATAVITLDGGGKIYKPLYARHLSGAAAGRRVEKRKNSWDPVLVDAPVGKTAPHGGSPTAPPNKVPAGKAPPR